MEFLRRIYNEVAGIEWNKACPRQQSRAKVGVGMGTEILMLAVVFWVDR